jgi:hypothetical protein
MKTVRSEAPLRGSVAKKTHTEDWENGDTDAVEPNTISRSGSAPSSTVPDKVPDKVSQTPAKNDLFHLRRLRRIRDYL